MAYPYALLLHVLQGAKQKSSRIKSQEMARAPKSASPTPRRADQQQFFPEAAILLPNFVNHPARFSQIRRGVRRASVHPPPLRTVPLSTAPPASRASPSERRSRGVRRTPNGVAPRDQQVFDAKSSGRPNSARRRRWVAPSAPRATRRPSSGPGKSTKICGRMAKGPRERSNCSSSVRQKIY